MEFDISQINELIASRRSVFPKQYTQEPVADHTIQQMLENANWAPTHGLTQPWRFVVFKGAGLKKLAEFQSGLYRSIAEEAGDFDQIKFDKLAKKPLMASHIIAIGMSRSLKGKVPEIEEVEAVACAVQNMYLTATAYGVGCYWGSGGITYRTEANAFFGLSESDKLLGFLYVGNVEGDWPKGRRKPIADKVEWISE
ncbi:MAG: nitroreductase [Cyclobacteriaceae bacterium]